MKKTVSKLIACGIVAGMLCTGSAMAAEIAASKADSVVTVNVTDLGAKEETTLLVVAKDVAIEDAFADTTKVYHIDQTAADDTGVATFSFTYSGTDALDIYSGYSSMSATDVPCQTVIDESASGGDEGDDPVTPVYTVGDVNNDGAVDGSDALAVIANFLKKTPFAFEYGTQAADVNSDGAVDGSDALAIIMNFLKKTPFQS